MSLIITVLMLGVIIMTHEFGYFLFAKLNRIGVIEFSFGMGPRLFSFEKGGTRYSSRVLSLSGSCVILREGEGITDESTFNDKSVWARISMVTARPVFNFILAFGLSMVLIGITGYDTTRLAGVMNGYPAQAAGMEAGDVIKSINGRKVHSYRGINWYLFTHPQKPLTVTWERTEEGGRMGRFSAELAPVFSTENNQYMTGVQFNPVPNMAENVGQLLIHNVYEVQYWIHYVLDAFHMMFHGMVSVNGINDPMGIVNAIDTAVDETAPYGVSAVILILISFTILLSTNLGIMNLLPIPALDGGRFVFLIIETVRGKPIDEEKEGMVHVAEIVVLLAPMVLILFNSVRKLF